MTRNERGNAMRLFYAELIDADGIADRGVFMSLEEFLPYRVKGWSGTAAIDAEADAALAQLCQKTYSMEGLPNKSGYRFLARLKDGTAKLATVIKPWNGTYTVGGVKYDLIANWSPLDEVAR